MDIPQYTTYIPCIYIQGYTMYIPGICSPQRYPWIYMVYPWIYHVYPAVWIYMVYPWIYHVYPSSIYMVYAWIYMVYHWMYIHGIYVVYRGISMDIPRILKPDFAAGPCCWSHSMRTRVWVNQECLFHAPPWQLRQGTRRPTKGSTRLPPMFPACRWWRR